jgi:hypothetical protein
MRSWKIGVMTMVTMGGVGGYLAVPKTVEAAGAFTLTSSDFKNNAAIPVKYSFNAMGCTGENVSPALEWKNPPAGTKSFALMAHDPDAPTGSGWWHWVVYNIPADATSLPEGAGAAAGTALPKAPRRGTPTSASLAGAVPARRPAAASTTTTSRCSR